MGAISGAHLVALARRRKVRRTLFALVIVSMGWLTLRTRQLGHDWGDDFALYIRQAQSLVDGFPHQVEVDNRFGLAASGWSTFSPPIYPWGWPMMMAPVVAVMGVDYEALKVLVVALWCTALTAWFMIVRQRSTSAGAWAVLLALGFSWPYLTWTNSVVSDIPYLAVAFTTLWWMDRCRAARAWHDGAVWRLVVMGLALSLAFNIRRDGVALVAALAALVGVQIVIEWRTNGSRGCSARWRRWALPFAVFAIASSVFQILLPSAVAPRYPGTGLSNVDDRLAWYRDILAQQLGLLSPDSDVIMLFGSHALGMAVLTVVVGLAIVGVVVRCATHPESDLPLAVFGLAHTAMVLVVSFQEGRYIFPIVPVLMYFSLQSVPTIVARARRPGRRTSPTTRILAPTTAVLFGALALSSLDDSLWWAERATATRERGEIMNGPARPETVEMTEAVTTITHPDDVVAFFRSRAMTMLTDRRSLQAGSIEPILAGADWYVMERGSTYSQPLLSLDEAESLGLVMVWSNERWIMFDVPDFGGEGR